MSGEEPATQIAPVESPQMVSTVKLHVLKKGEYTLWSMRMEQYLTNTDYSLWQVILSSDGPIQVTTNENGVETQVPPKTAQALLQRQRERKAKSILLLAINEYQLRFHGIKDAKTLWAAIKSRFGGNVESKKMQKNVLKQQFENFYVSDTEGLDKAYDRPTTNKTCASVSQVKISITPPINTSVEMPRVESVRPSGVIIEDWVHDMMSGKVQVSTAKKSSLRATTSTSTFRPVNTATHTNRVNGSKFRTNAFHKFHSPIRSAVKGNRVTAVKASAGCVWRPKMTDLNNVSKDNSGSWVSKRGNPQQALKNKGIFDSGCSRHMTGNKDFLIDYQGIDYDKPVLLWKPNKALTKDEDGEDVDTHLYRSMIGSLMYLTSSRPDIMLISWQCKKQTVVANSTTKAKYIAASHCCGQVLWIQNQMLDYGYNFMQTKIHVDNESVICVVKNPVYHSKTKHIEIRHHFIRDSYEKKLIEMVIDTTDYNDQFFLLNAFDVLVVQFFLIARIGLELQGYLINDGYADLVRMLVTLTTIFSLEKRDKNAESHRIVDFLSTCSINYALTLKDLPEPFNDTYVTPCHTKKVFSNMARKSVNFSGNITLLFASMLLQTQEPEGEGSAVHPEPQPTPSTSQPNVSEPQIASPPIETSPTAAP
ncbi:hypothetical protein Tco_0637731 [Tanacetum coccineum]